MCEVQGADRLPTATPTSAGQYPRLSSTMQSPARPASPRQPAGQPPPPPPPPSNRLRRRKLLASRRRGQPGQARRRGRRSCTRNRHRRQSRTWQPEAGSRCSRQPQGGWVIGGCCCYCCRRRHRSGGAGHEENWGERRGVEGLSVCVCAKCVRVCVCAARIAEVDQALDVLNDQIDVVSHTQPGRWRQDVQPL